MTPLIFYRFMDNHVKVITGCVLCLGSILVIGTSDADHENNLDIVLSRLNEVGIKLNKANCHFFSDSVEYVGHTIYRHGIHSLPFKTKALRNASEPKIVGTEILSINGQLPWAKLSNLSETLELLQNIAVYEPRV